MHARSRTPAARPLPVYCASLRTAEPELLDAAGTGRRDGRSPCWPPAARSPATASAGGDDEAWDVGAAGRAGRPDPAGPLPDQPPRRSGRPTTTACRPLDVATQVAVPEFDGRHHHRAVLVQGDRRRRADRLRRRPRALPPGSPASRCAHARLRHIPPADKRIALDALGVPDQARPDRQRGRPGHPGQRRRAAARDARRRLRRIGDIPGVDARDGDALIHALIERRRPGPGLADRGAAGGQPGPDPGRATTARWFATLPAELARRRRASTGVRRRASCSSTAATIPTARSCIAALQAGNVVLMVQPPRGFGENPVAIYHDPDLPPSHHYLAAYRWLRRATAVRRRRGRAPRQARQPGVAARQDARHVRGLRHRRGARRPAADLPVPGQRPGRGHPGQAPRARHARRPPHPADGPRRDLRRHRPAGAAARRARQHRRAGPGQAAGHPRSRSGR